MFFLGPTIAWAGSLSTIFLDSANLKKLLRALSLLLTEVAVCPPSIMLSIQSRIRSESTDSQVTWLSFSLKYDSNILKSSS